MHFSFTDAGTVADSNAPRDCPARRHFVLQDRSRCRLCFRQFQSTVLQHHVPHVQCVQRHNDYM